MTKLKKISLLLLLSVALTGCNDDDPIQNAIDEIDEQVTQYAELQETWESACGESRLLNTSLKTVFDFKGNDFEERKVLYSDASCNESIAEVMMNGEFDIEGGRDEKDLNLNYKSMSVRVDSEAAVTVVDAVNFCGVDNWKAGETRVIADVNNNQCFVSNIPSTKYGKVLVDDSEDVMYLSTEFSDDPNGRPQSVDRGNAFRDND